MLARQSHRQIHQPPLYSRFTALLTLYCFTHAYSRFTALLTLYCFTALLTLTHALLLYSRFTALLALTHALLLYSRFTALLTLTHALLLYSRFTALLLYSRLLTLYLIVKSTNPHRGAEKKIKNKKKFRKKVEEALPGIHVYFTIYYVLIHICAVSIRCMLYTALYSLYSRFIARFTHALLALLQERRGSRFTRFTHALLMLYSCFTRVTAGEERKLLRSATVERARE